MLEDLLKERNQINKDANLNRTLYPIIREGGSSIKIENSLLTNFTSNDYLGLANDPRIKKSLIDAVELYGMGSSASPLVSGYSKHHQMLEESFAEFVGFPRSILFNSGYHANIGMMSALGSINPTIIMDKLAHASIIDGVRLSAAKFQRYSHNDMSKLEKILNREDGNKIIITESIHSMEGDIAPLADLASLSKKYQSSLIVDDAHGIGIMGENGKGTHAHYNLNNTDIAALVMPLGKAFGSCGAIIAGSEDLIDFLRQFARSYIYSTSLPPAIAYANLEMLKIITHENYRRDRLNELILFFNDYAKSLGLSLISDHITPIRSIIIPCNVKLIKIRDELAKLGYFVSAIRTPTVPKNLSRLRLSLNFHHQEFEIKTLLELIAKRI